MRRKRFSPFFVICINYLCLTMSWDQAGILPCFCAWRAARSRTSFLKIPCGWRTAPSKQTRPGTLLGISCSVSSWEEFGWHHHTQVGSRCLLWSPSLSSLCRWLRTKGLVGQFRARSWFFSAVTNNDCTNLKANMQWKKLFLGALFQDQR